MERFFQPFELNDFETYRDKKIRNLKALDEAEPILSSEEDQFCSNLSQLLKSTRFDLNTEYIYDSLTHQFFNASILKGFTCLLHAITSKSLIEGGNVPVLNKTIQRYFTGLEYLASGMQGATLLMKLGNSENDLFLMKVSNEEDVVFNLLHEYTIGVYLNRLRSAIPNFMYVYGLFRCDRLPSDKKLCNSVKVDKYKLNPRNPDAYSYYLMIENVRGKTLEYNLKNLYTRFNKNLNLANEMVSSWMAQLFLALYFANSQLGYSHGDIHTQNIILRETGEDYKYIFYQHFNYLIPKRGKKKDDRVKYNAGFYVKTIGIPTIIDLGYSSLVYPNQEREDPYYLGTEPEITVEITNSMIDVASVLISHYLTSQDKKEKEFYAEVVKHFRDKVIKPYIPIVTQPFKRAWLKEIFKNDVQDFEQIDKIASKEKVKELDAKQYKLLFKYLYNLGSAKTRVKDNERDRVLSCAYQECQDFEEFLNRSVILKN